MLRRFHSGSLLFASFVATFFMTIAFEFFSIDLIKLFGKIAGASENALYIVGFGCHFGMGLVYGLFYALCFEPLFYRLSKFFCGCLFSLIPFFVFHFYGEKSLQTLEKIFPKQEEIQLYTPSKTKGEEYVHRLSKKRQKLSGGAPLHFIVDEVTQTQMPPLWVSLAGYFVFGLSLSLIYRPKEPKIWCS